MLWYTLNNSCLLKSKRQAHINANLSVCCTAVQKNKHVIPDSISYSDYSFDYKGRVFIYVVEKDIRTKLLLLVVDHSDIQEKKYKSLDLK